MSGMGYDIDRKPDFKRGRDRKRSAGAKAKTIARKQQRARKNFGR